MKRVISISIGSSSRDSVQELVLGGQRIRVERIGTDGDMRKARMLFRELDGEADAFGLGGADMGFLVGKRYYPFPSVMSMVNPDRTTPVVDGSGIKRTLESRIAPFIDKKIGEYINRQGRSVFIAVGTDRWFLAQSFIKSDYDYVLGDLMFVLGITIPIRSVNTLNLMARLCIPVLSRLPFRWLYPTGEKEGHRIPRFEKYFRSATVIAGDCHYLKRHLPPVLPGKVIVTNTTTAADMDLFRNSGIRYVVTTTPVFNGRSFGTNVVEAILVALAGKGRALQEEELEEMLRLYGIGPQITDLY